MTPSDPPAPASNEAGAPLPPLAPLSRRIAHHADAMGRLLARCEATGEPRIDGIADESLVRPPVELAQIGPDPADAISRIKPGRTRELERPNALDEQLEQRTPQFFLRNTARLERYGDPSWIETTYRPLRSVDHWSDLDFARQGAVEAIDLEPDTSSIRLAIVVAERRVVMVETRWNEVFGRPDPAE